MKRILFVIAMFFIPIGCDDSTTPDEPQITLEEFAHDFATFRCDTFWECCFERNGFFLDPNYATYDECYQTLKAEYENGFSIHGVEESLEGLIAYSELFKQYYGVGCEEPPNYEYGNELNQSIEGTYRGTYAEGHSCTLDWQCLGDLRCINDQCSPPLEFGDSCARSSDCADGLFCNLVCEQLLEEGDPCIDIKGELECPSQELLYCDMNDKYCKLRRPEGSTCEVKEECATHDCSQEGKCIWNEKPLYEEVCNNP